MNFYECLKHPMIRLKVRDPKTGKKFRIRLSGGRNQHQLKNADVVLYLDTFKARNLLIFDNRNEIGEHKEQHKMLFFIPDGGTPDNKEKFKETLKILAKNLLEGLHVHVTCIGGHGRTGMVLACLLGKYLKIKDPVNYVRETYCKEAIETYRQHKFVVDFTGKGTQPKRADYQHSWLFSYCNTSGYELNQPTKSAYYDDDGNFLYETVKPEPEKTISEQERLDAWYIKRYGISRDDFLNLKDNGMIDC